MALATLFELQGVGIKFGSETVLENINLQVFKGENLVLIGPSGQGKSVLLKIMAGILKPHEGRVLFEGKDFYAQPQKAQNEMMRKMGMLFQNNALFDSLTCAENIGFPLEEVRGASAKEVQEKVNYFLEAVAISPAQDLYPDEISGGMQKRLGIARALALDPEIVFYDDPTAGLDPITSRKIVSLILELQKKRCATTVSVTNDMNRAYQLADRISMVVDKGVLLTGSPSETRQHADPRVQQFISGRLEGPLTQ